MLCTLGCYGRVLGEVLGFLCDFENFGWDRGSSSLSIACPRSLLNWHPADRPAFDRSGPRTVYSIG